jgi:hypothetical protein
MNNKTKQKNPKNMKELPVLRNPIYASNVEKPLVLPVT